MTKKTITIILIILIIIIFKNILIPVRASEQGDLVFTEIMYDLEGADESREWVEIFNKSTSTVAIITGSGADSWRFNDGSNHLLSLYQGTADMESGEIAIIADDGLTFMEEHPDYQGTIFETAMNLANSGDTIGLSSDAGQTLFSEVAYEAGWGAAANSRTLEKIDFNGGDQADNWQESFILGGSPGASSTVESLNQPPVAVAGPDQTVWFGQTVYFDGTGSTDPDDDQLDYLWDFGDLNSGEGATTTHDYSATGTFEVILTVWDGEAENQDELTVEIIEAPNTSPQADAGPDQSVEVGQEVIFDGSSSSDPDNDPLSYSWTISNTVIGSGAMINYSFASQGEYVVDLTVSDGQATSTDFLRVNVTEPVMESTYDYSAIFINELMPNPAGSDDNEWFEFYNQGDSIINLENLKIKDNSSSFYIVEAADFLTTYINPGSFFVINRDVSGLALNNSGGDCLNLLTTDDEIIYSVCYQETALEDQSYARQNDNSWSWTGLATAGAANQFSQVTEPEPELEAEPTTSAEPGAAPQDYSVLIISEFLPNPAGSDLNEFIELYNQSEEAIDLTGCQLDDDEGGSTPYKFTEKIIAPQEYLPVYQSETKVVLNNSSDSARLLDPTGEIVFQASYDTVTEGKSYNYDQLAREWFQGEPSPGEQNLIGPTPVAVAGHKEEGQVIEEPVSDFYSMSELKQLDKGQEVTTWGVVTVPPDVLGGSYFYVSEYDLSTDEAILETGCQVYNLKKEFPKLAVGDVIQVTGIISENRGEKRVKTKTSDDIMVIKTINMMAPPLVTASDIGEELEGGFIALAGEILDRKKTTLMLGDDTGEVKIYATSQSGLNFNDLEEGYWLDLQGIVSETTAGYRILPRFATDIKSGEVVTDLNEVINIDQEKILMPEKTNFTQKYLLIILAGLVLAGSLALVAKTIIVKTKNKKNSS